MFAKIVKGGRRDKSKMKFSDSTLPGRLSVALNIVQCGIGTGSGRSRCRTEYARWERLFALGAEQQGVAYIY